MCLKENGLWLKEKGHWKGCVIVTEKVDII